MNQLVKDSVEVIDLERFAFDLINQLADEYSIYDDGSFTQAIWATNTAEQMDRIITRLQGYLLIVMRPE